jgi:hypothetical protein
VVAQAAFELGQLAAEVLDRGTQGPRRAAAARFASVGALAQRVDDLAHACRTPFEAVALELVAERVWAGGGMHGAMVPDRRRSIPP